MDSCTFCRIIEGKIPCQMVFESRSFIVIKDIHPKSPGHSLVIPKKHFNTFLDLPKDLYREFMDTIKDASEKILASVGKRAFNLVMNNFPEAGQDVMHVHLHIIPRG